MIPSTGTPGFLKLGINELIKNLNKEFHKNKLNLRFKEAVKVLNDASGLTNTQNV